MLILKTFWLDICKLMRTRIQFRIQLINFDADPGADPDPDFYSMWMRIRMRTQVIKMRILADPDPYPDPNPPNCLKQSANCVFLCAA